MSHHFRKKAVALYDFYSSDREELSLSQGEVIWIERMSEDGWILATNKQGKSGFVPGNYIQMKENKAKIVENERNEFIQKVSSSPLFKFRNSLSLNSTVQAICCSKNFFVLSCVNKLFVYDLKRQVVVERSINSLLGEGNEGGFEKILLFNKFVKKDQTTLVEEFVGVTSRKVTHFRIYWSGLDLKIETKVLVDDQKVSTSMLFTKSGKSSLVFLSIPVLHTRHSICTINCSRFDGEKKERNDIFLFSAFKNFHYMCYYKRKSELLILFCSSVLQIVFIKTDSSGFPKPQVFYDDSHNRNTNIVGKRLFPLENVYNFDSIDSKEYEVLSLNKTPSPNRDRKPIYVYPKILESRDLCVVSELPDKPSCQLLYLIDLINKSIQRKVHVDQSFMSFEIIGDKYLWFPRTPETEQDVKESENVFYKVGNLNLENMQVDDTYDFKIIIPVPFSVDFNENMFSTLVPADWERGETGLKLVVWEIGAHDSDGLFGERKDFLLNRKRKDEKVLDFFSVKTSMVCMDINSSSGGHSCDFLCFPRIFLFL